MSHYSPRNHTALLSASGGVSLRHTKAVSPECGAKNAILETCGTAAKQRTKRLRLPRQPETEPNLPLEPEPDYATARIPEPRPAEAVIPHPVPACFSCSPGRMRIRCLGFGGRISLARSLPPILPRAAAGGTGVRMCNMVTGR